MENKKVAFGLIAVYLFLVASVQGYWEQLASPPRGGADPGSALCAGTSIRQGMPTLFDNGEFLIDTSITYLPAPENQEIPRGSFDGTNYLVMWQDNRSGSFDIYGARVSPDGVVLDRGPVVVQQGNQRYPALTGGQGNPAFLVYQGWTGKVGNKTYNTNRIWGKIDPNVGVRERTTVNAQRSTLNATIVRAVLFLSGAVGGERSAVGADLLDISGRKVLDLHPGANDVRRLPPGVYFVHQPLIKSGTSVMRAASSVQKVVITR